MMLKGIPSLLGPELLAALRAMGHGDEIAIVDGNYPADAHGRRVIRLDGSDVPAVLEAILTLMPLDHDVDAAFRPCASGDRELMTPIFDAFESIIARFDPAVTVQALDAPDFYHRVQHAYLVVATGERRLFGNIIVRKGVIKPEA